MTRRGPVLEMSRWLLRVIALSLFSLFLPGLLILISPARSLPRQRSLSSPGRFIFFAPLRLSKAHRAFEKTAVFTKTTVSRGFVFQARRLICAEVSGLSNKQRQRALSTRCIR